MTEYFPEEPAGRAGVDGGLEYICYKSYVNHLSALDECDTEDTTHVQSSSNKTTNSSWRSVHSVILHELL